MTNRAGRLLKTFLSCLTIIAATGLLALQVTREMGISPDSYHYLDISHTIAVEGTIGSYVLNANSANIPDRNVLWPPLYPVVLAVPQLFGCRPVLAARVCAMLLFVAACVLSARICHLLVGRQFAVACYALMLLSLVATGVFQMVWSETLFLALTLLFLLSCLMHIRRGHARFAFLAGLATGLMCLTRYAGLAALPVGCLAICQRCFLDRNRWRGAGSRLTMFLVPIIALMGPWFVRQYMTTENGRMLGPGRPLSTLPLSWHLHLVLETFRDNIEYGLALAGIAAVAALRVRDVWRKGVAIRSLRLHCLFILFCFIVIYTAQIVALSYRWQFDPISTRLLCPAFLPLVILGTVMTYYQIVQYGGIHAARKLAALASAILLLLIGIRYLPLNPLGWREMLRSGSSGVSDRETYDWVGLNTQPSSLIVGEGTWAFRLLTGRLVLESGYPEMPPLTKDNIEQFLARYHNTFDEAWLVAHGTGALARAFGELPIVFQSGQGTTVRRLR